MNIGNLSNSKLTIIYSTFNTIRFPGTEECVSVYYSIIC
nr:MAG TPA: hypothetical protein [Caudoviricetes sp.]